MTTPDDPINGSTPPHILELALSGKMAAAAGGDTDLDRDEAVAAVQAAYTPQEDAPAPVEAPTPPPLPETALAPPTAKETSSR